MTPYKASDLSIDNPNEFSKALHFNYKQWNKSESGLIK